MRNASSSPAGLKRRRGPASRRGTAMQAAATRTTAQTARVAPTAAAARARATPASSASESASGASTTTSAAATARRIVARLAGRCRIQPRRPSVTRGAAQSASRSARQATIICSPASGRAPNSPRARPCTTDAGYMSNITAARRAANRSAEERSASRAPTLRWKSQSAMPGFEGINDSRPGTGCCSRRSRGPGGWLLPATA